MAAALLPPISGSAKTTVSLVPNGATEKHRDSSEQHSYNHRTLQQADPSHRVVVMSQFLRHRGRDRLNASDSAIASYFAWGMVLVGEDSADSAGLLCCYFAISEEPKARF